MYLLLSRRNRKIVVRNLFENSDGRENLMMALNSSNFQQVNKRIRQRKCDGRKMMSALLQQKSINISKIVMRCIQYTWPLVIFCSFPKFKYLMFAKCLAYYRLKIKTIRIIHSSLYTGT